MPMNSLEQTLTAQGIPLWSRLKLTAVTVFLAGLLWWPTFHLFFGKYQRARKELISKFPLRVIPDPLDNL